MANLTKKYLEMIKEKKGVESSDDAYLILDGIRSFVKEEELEEFINFKLFVHNSKENAYEWYYSDDYACQLVEDLKTMTMTQDMIGKSLMDIVLDSKESWLKISNNLYITYYL